MKMSIVVPAHNEQDNIIDVLDKIERFLDGLGLDCEMVVVNDHSTDNTARLVSEMSKQHDNIRLIENKLRPGFANALKSGFNSAQGEVVVPVMGDLCDDLSAIKAMFKKINEGYDVVCGSRYMERGARLGGSKIKGFFSRFVGVSLHYLLGLPTRDISNAFKMYRKSVLEGMAIESTSFEISMEIPVKAYYSGFKIAEVPTVWKERTRGKSNFRMYKLLPAYLNLYVWAIFKKISRG